MIFSVFDHNARCFNYYEAPGTAANYGARGTKYRALSQGPQGPMASSVTGLGGGGRPGERVCIGFAPEALAIKLPSNARRVGSGSAARGVIAVVSGSMNALGAIHHAPYAERFQGARPRMHDTEIRPAYPNRYEEEGGTYNGVDGLGADVDVAPEQRVIATTPFAQIVLAASIAAIVGVVVQRMLNKWK